MNKNLTDRDYLNYLLSYLKEMVKNYAIALTEVSNEKLYYKYKKLFDEYSIMQREVFNYMLSSGWYQLKMADSSKIEEKYLYFKEEMENS